MASLNGITGMLKSKINSEKGVAIRNRVTGALKRDDSSSHASAPDYSTTPHVSRPISSLRDPASFGPPPRHVALTGGSGSSTPRHSHDHDHDNDRRHGHAAIEAPPSARPPLPARTPSNLSSISHQTSTDENQEPPPPPRPYRADTTGLSTGNLPPPPMRRDGSDARQLPPRQTPAVPRAATTPAAPPSLPPRLPPRASPAASPHPSPPVRSSAPPASDGYLNQAAINRLGNAGISVPGLGIGGGGGASHSHATAAPALAAVASAAHATSSSSSPAHKATPQMSELQARFAKMGTNASAPVAASAPPPRPPSAGVATKKKPPPPPPPSKKKPSLAAAHPPPPPPVAARRDENDDEDDEPPPIPMATRPQRW